MRTLTEQATICHQLIELLEAGQSFSRADVMTAAGKLLDACQNLRDAILSEDSTASWSTKSELAELVTRMEDTAAKRRRYLDLAQTLAAGTVVHRRERTRLERLSLRDAAVSELMEISERSPAPELPGPGVETWLQWACGLEDQTDQAELQKLKAGFPRLDTFISELEFDWWKDQSSPSEDSPRLSLSINGASNGSHGSHVDENGNGADLPVLVTQKKPAAEIVLPEAEPLEERVEIADEPETLDESAVLNLEFKLSSAGEKKIPADLLSPSRKGRISLFPWDQVDQFTTYIERAKVERKDVRKVRSLLALSHWIDPVEHNPVLHPKCGIRALTGYSGATEISLVSPNDALQAIATDDGLPLLAGGADLLRWGLLQPSERNLQGIATVRRLSAQHLKAWFSDIYRIALSDKQIEDIYNLTSGIPYLVGELHKLIIPVPDDPPTWLGLARWIEIKAQFEKLIPEFAHELKKGVPAARLTDREISLLNMVVIVSGGSSTETIVANLSENWERYQHPEYRALGARDEISIAVLLELGLLPRRNVTGVEPSLCLMPVSQDDAIRRIVESL
jgi:hypothetical protein